METLEHQVSQVLQVPEVIKASEGLMGPEGTRDRMLLQGRLGTEDLQALSEIQETQEGTVVVMMGVQVLQGPRAPLDSPDQEVTVITAPKDPKASLDHQGFRDLKDFVAFQVNREHQVSSASLGALEQRDREEMMGPEVNQAPRG